MIASLNINWTYLFTRDLTYCAGDPNQIYEYLSFTLYIFNYSSIYIFSSRNRSTALDVEKEKGSASSNRSFPSLDTTEMYYTLDFSDSQSSPLIQ